MLDRLVLVSCSCWQPSLTHTTVRETLTYAARLRLPASLADEAISVIVEQTIDELGLRDAAETVVGGPLRKGISGGEKRYV
jgi:ABC-type multidrug transport system ATPase subunit